MSTLAIEETPLQRLRPHPDNPRKGDVEKIVASFERFGVYQPIVAQRSTGHILAGNHRYLAARAKGLTDLPVVWLDVDDATARAILVADNRLSDVATYDDGALAQILQELQSTDALAGTGWGAEDVEALVKSLTDVPDEGDHAGELPGTVAVIVECVSEAEQLELIEELVGRGLTCRAAVI